MTDNVNHPSHYNNGSVECIDAMEAATVNKSGAEAVCTSNIIRYLWRYESKNGLEDVKKAQWYLNRLIAELEGKTAVAPEPKTEMQIVEEGIVEKKPAVKVGPVECEECDHVWKWRLTDPEYKTCIVCGKVEDKEP